MIKTIIAIGGGEIGRIKIHDDGRAEQKPIETIPEKTYEQKLSEVNGESLDILLVKEANREQLQIAERIEHSNAVLVQGPPGTGKTHTIANLLGHFMSQGKTILVTSQTAKALSVLKSQLPKQLQNLCISLLDDSNRDMVKAIEEIADILSNPNTNEHNKEQKALSIERQNLLNTEIGKQIDLKTLSR